MSNLILTGFGWSEYAVAAAVALKGLDGKSDVVGVSKRRLPEYLEALPSDWKRIYIVGVSLGGDEERLANALKRLKANGVQVSWISAYAPSESQQANILPHLKAQIGETVLGEDDFASMLNEHREMNAGLTDGACSESGLVPDELEAAIRIHVRRVYDKYGQNLSKAAEALKVARNTAKKYL